MYSKHHSSKFEKNPYSIKKSPYSQKISLSDFQKSQGYIGNRPCKEVIQYFTLLGKMIKKFSKSKKKKKFLKKKNFLKKIKKLELVVLFLNQVKVIGYVKKIIVQIGIMLKDKNVIYVVLLILMVLVVIFQSVLMKKNGNVGFVGFVIVGMVVVISVKKEGLEVKIVFSGSHFFFFLFKVFLFFI